MKFETRNGVGRCFPYFAKHYYCSICLPVCVYNHKQWARDFEGFSTKLWPEIHIHEPPPPTDLPADRRHAYVQIKRLGATGARRT